jgi:sulfur relay (sulfurtransferase) DsrC/TusE family protein
MKNKKEILLRIDENLYLRIKELSKNNKSINQTMIDLIEKGLSKNQNDYRELLNFLSKNIVTKINKEFTDYRYFLRKFLLNNSVIPPIQPEPKNEPAEAEKPEQKKSAKQSFFEKISQD